MAPYRDVRRVPCGTVKHLSVRFGEDVLLSGDAEEHPEPLGLGAGRRAAEGGTSVISPLGSSAGIALRWIPLLHWLGPADHGDSLDMLTSLLQDLRQRPNFW